MQSFAIEALGLLSGTLTTISFLPQVIKVLKSRQTRDLSLAMYLVFTAGVAGWFLYGVLIGSLSIIVANGVTFALAATLLVMKLRLG